jgi:putative chitinase
MGRYGITTPKQQAAFLATICYESQYLQKTKEGLARKGTKARAYQDKYWSTGYYGRGLIQLTHSKNYDAFSEYVYAAGVAHDRADVTDHPDILEQPRWAVESACWYWKVNNLNGVLEKFGFVGTQGLINRGSINKIALDEETRFALYTKALVRIQSLTPATLPADTPPVVLPNPTQPSEESTVPPSTSEQSANSDTPRTLSRIKSIYTKCTSYFDSGNAQIGQAVARKDAAKSTWALISGGVGHALWALVAFFLGIPKELYITAAVIVGVLLVVYLIRQLYLGGIREKKV